MHASSEIAEVLPLASAKTLGFSEEKIRWLVTSGRWQRIFPRVYATFSGPIPYSAMLHAAVLYGGKGAALSHHTAGHAYALCRRPGSIHITIPFGRKITPQPGLLIHRSRTLRSTDIRNVVPAMTTIERTVIDLLPGKATARAALSLVGDAVRSRRTTADRLRVALSETPATRWRNVVLDALPDVAAGAHSVLELLDAKQRRLHGLPMGRRQFTRKANGVEHLDVLIEDYRTHIELDGQLGHDGTLDVWRDMDRDNRSEVRRLRHLRYGWADMYDRPCEVMRQQAGVLHEEGWSGQVRRCKRCPE